MKLKKGIEVLLRGMGQIMFQKNEVTGALFLLGILVASLPMFVAASLGLAASTAAACMLKYNKKEIDDGLYGFNGALTGIALLFFFKEGAALIASIVAFSALSSVVMNAMLKAKIPPYTFPFVISAWIAIALISLTGAIIPQSSFPIQAIKLDLISGVTLGFSQVMFQANIVTALLFALGIFVSSKRAALFALLGSMIGFGFAAAISMPLGQTNHGIFCYNGVLCGIAFSGVNRHAMMGAVAASALSVVIVAGFALANIPALTAPFVFATWIMMAERKNLQ
jgi:urea transporter